MTGPLLASGREADVYTLDDRREADVTGEVAAMRRLAGLGYPGAACRAGGGARSGAAPPALGAAGEATRLLDGTEPLGPATAKVRSCAR